MDSNTGTNHDSITTVRKRVHILEHAERRHAVTLAETQAALARTHPSGRIGGR
jgi:hypothetical protein